jgi:hypothetical protein
MVARRFGTGAVGGTRLRHIFGIWSPALIVIAMPCVRSKRHPDSSDEMRPVFAPPHPVLRRMRALSSPLRLLELHCLPLVLV